MAAANGCSLPYLNLHETEEAIRRQWLTVSFTDAQVQLFSERAREDLRASAESGARLIADQRRRLVQLERQKQKLLDAYMADALPMDLLKERQVSVGAEIADAKRLIANAQSSGDVIRGRLEQILDLLRHAEQLYSACGPEARQLLNSAVFQPFVVDVVDDGPVTAPTVVRAELAPVVAAVIRPAAAAEAGKQGSGDEETLGIRNGAEGSNLTHLAGQLTNDWKESRWQRLAKLIDVGPPATPVIPSRSSRRQAQCRPGLELAEAIRVEYEAGASLERLAARYGIDDDTVARSIRRAGGQTRPRRPAIPADVLDRARSLRAAGWSYDRIGREIGYSGPAVYRRLRADGSLRAHD